jgi:hypothetical protein
MTEQHILTSTWTKLRKLFAREVELRAVVADLKPGSIDHMEKSSMHRKAMDDLMVFVQRHAINDDTMATLRRENTLNEAAKKDLRTAQFKRSAKTLEKELVDHLATPAMAAALGVTKVKVEVVDRGTIARAYFERGFPFAEPMLPEHTDGGRFARHWGTVAGVPYFLTSDARDAHKWWSCAMGPDYRYIELGNFATEGLAFDAAQGYIETRLANYDRVAPGEQQESTVPSKQLTDPAAVSALSDAAAGKDLSGHSVAALRACLNFASPGMTAFDKKLVVTLKKAILNNEKEKTMSAAKKTTEAPKTEATGKKSVKAAPAAAPAAEKPAKEPKVAKEPKAPKEKKEAAPAAPEFNEFGYEVHIKSTKASLGRRIKHLEVAIEAKGHDGQAWDDLKVKKAKGMLSLAKSDLKRLEARMADEKAAPATASK